MEDLKMAVRAIVSYNVREMSKEDRGKWLEDLANHGCISGMVSGLIYYHETEAFTEKHREAIMEMLALDLEEGLIDGYFLAAKIKGGNFDNFLAWYAFEKIALEGLEF
jgi:hypothetical protein